MADRDSQTLTELEHHDWGPPAYDSQLVKTIHELRYKPIGHFTDSDLRICVGQNVGLLFLVPLALSRLEAEPLLDASFYAGDLLVALLQADADFWNRQTHFARQLLLIAERAASETDDSHVLNAISAFSTSHGRPNRDRPKSNS